MMKTGVPESATHRAAAGLRAVHASGLFKEITDDVLNKSIQKLHSELDQGNITTVADTLALVEKLLEKEPFSSNPILQLFVHSTIVKAISKTSTQKVTGSKKPDLESDSGSDDDEDTSDFDDDIDADVFSDSGDDSAPSPQTSSKRKASGSGSKTANPFVSSPLYCTQASFPSNKVTCAELKKE